MTFPCRVTKVSALEYPAWAPQATDPKNMECIGNEHEVHLASIDPKVVGTFDAAAVILFLRTRDTLGWNLKPGQMVRVQVTVEE